MIYLKSVAAGIVAAVATALLSGLIAALGMLSWLRFELWRQSGAEGGIGAVSAGVAERAVTVAIILGAIAFLVGFRWEFRRASR